MQNYRFFRGFIEMLLNIFEEELTLMKRKFMNMLSKKEIMFCYQYVKTGNSKEAAINSGYVTSPEKMGEELLAKKEISDTIEKFFQKKKKDLIYKATIGYERLAFGSISDCIKLLFSENFNLKELSKMDLFNISEIKKPKDGAMEIKFFDRIKALEKLEQIDSNHTNEKMPFYLALENSVDSINNGKNINSEE